MRAQLNLREVITGWFVKSLKTGELQLPEIL
jgi:hypothetical protein